MSSEDQFTWWDRDIVLQFVSRSRGKRARRYRRSINRGRRAGQMHVSTTHGGSSRMTHSLTRRPMFSCMVGNTTMKIIRVVTYYRYYFYLHFARALFGYDDDMWCITSTKYIYKYIFMYIMQYNNKGVYILLLYIIL